jgi:hypothetical protein
MHSLNHTPPEKMTPAQRRAEVAALIANGLVRLRGQAVAESRTVPLDSEFGLGFGSHKSVHGLRTIPVSSELI